MNQLCSTPAVPSAGRRATGLRALFLGLLAALVLVGTATAQTPRREMVSITGRIIDVTNGEPIPGVLVVIPGTGVRAETNELGEFSVSGIAVGLYRLQLSHPDYNPAVGDFTVMRAGGFQTAMQPVVRVGDELITGIMGELSDRNTGNALAGASVRVNGGQAGTLTDGRGRFLLDELSPGQHLIEFRQFGYSTRLDTLTVVAGRVTNVTASLSVDPLEMEPLEVVVERREVALQMTGFYTRQEEGFGEFIDRETIEFRGPSEMTDLFTGIPGVYLEVGGGGLQRYVVLRSGRLETISPDGGEPGHCYPRVYLDDMVVHMGGDDPAILDDLISPGAVAGVEIYPSSAGMPARYAAVGAACGVVIIWTRR